MAYTTIDNGEEHFNTILYTGDGSADNDITGVGFAPDWVWAKNRGAADAHWVLDSTRGATKGLYTNGNAAENTQNHLISFDSDGFSVGNQANGLNTSSNNYVAWNWKANGGTTTTNDASATSVGTIDSVYQANTTAGFSIVTYTGTGSAGTIAHGLGATPKTYWVKRRSSGTADWYIYHSSIGATKNLRLNKTDASNTDSNIFNDTEPTSSVFSLGSSFSNTSSKDYVAYCFAEIKGYSKFGKFRGNANADGAFIYTGFKPAWLMIKNIGASGTGYHWYIWDNKRDTINVMDNTLHADESNAENTFDQDIDFVSNGFKLRGSGVGMNPNSHDAIYMAFAEHPFVSSKGAPVTAR